MSGLSVGADGAEAGIAVRMSSSAAGDCLPGVDYHAPINCKTRALKSTCTTHSMWVSTHLSTPRVSWSAPRVTGCRPAKLWNTGSAPSW